MELIIGTAKFELFNGLSVSLAYDNVASTFGFSVFFDSENPVHKACFKPGSYKTAIIQHEGKTILTGTILKHSFSTQATRSLVDISGYSKAGVLEDCEIPTSSYPLQTSGLSLRQLAEKLCKPFGINVIVEPSIAAKVDQKIGATTADDSQSIRSYLAEIACHKHIVISHNAMGDLLMTEPAPSRIPIFDFTSGMPGVKISNDIDGQAMHSELTFQKQATKRGKGNAGQAGIKNPYCEGYRPKTTRQTSGKEVDTKDAVHNAMAAELQAIQIKIEIVGWELNGQLVTPNKIVSVLAPECYIYNRTNLFIQNVELKGDAASRTATLTCVVPEVFIQDPPKNIFN